jgi:16S rRNA (guanine527-N7)-methyltransferase
MEIIRRYFPDLSTQQYDQYSMLSGLYTEWNEKINVISRKDIGQLYLHHVLHSLAISKYICFAPGTRIMDAGTGGGFPGIPLAIMFPDVNFILTDSIAKKIKVVEAVISGLELKNCKAIHLRAEQAKEKFDFVTCRAVAPLPVFISWVCKLITGINKNQRPNGILAFKGGDLSEELSLPYRFSIINLSEYFSEPFFETKKLIHIHINCKN